MSGTPLVRPGAQPQLDYGASEVISILFRTTPDSGLGADDQMRHQERRVPPPGFAHPPPHPQFIPQDGAVGGPHHQSGPGAYGPCDGNFDKEKVPYEGPSPFHRSSRYETDPSAMSGDQMVYNRAQPMVVNQNHQPGARYDESNPSRMMHPPGAVPNHGNPPVGVGYSQVSGYYGMGGAGGVGNVAFQRPPIPAVPSGYEGDVVHSQTQPPPHQMQQTVPQYYSPNQPPPSSMPYQVQASNGLPVYSGQPMQQQDPQQQHQAPPPMGPPPQAVVTVQQRGGGQFIVPVPHPQMMTPHYIGQQVMPASGHYPPAGVYMQHAVRPAVFVPRGDMGYAPVEPSQPVMVPMPFVVHQMPPNQAPEQAPYQQGVMEQQPPMTVDQYGEQEFGPSSAPIQPVRPMSMPPGIPTGMQPMMGMMSQPPQNSVPDSRSATASIPPLVTQPSGYGPSPQARMYGFHPGALAPPFMMAPHFGMPHMMHSSPSRGRNSRNNSSFRGPSSYHNRNKQNHSPQTYSRQSSVIDSVKDDSKTVDMASVVSAEVEKLTLKQGEENKGDVETEQQEAPQRDEKAEEEKEEGKAKPQDEQQEAQPPADLEPEKKPEEGKATKELLPVAVSKTDGEKRGTVPIVAVAPTVSVKAETVQAKEKELNEEELPEKPSLELRIKESTPQASVQPLPTSDSSTPVKLDCTFCRSLGKPEDVCTSHV
ncbi:hypothetical protein ANCCEY_09999 [Ancylostoma ceylanicum]|uniref:Uncharacterized protein n=1 Tax=Ancylostoma ceylanicum TaxID=53326 RepID=A0A0D6LG29_9BILA|nr:hypothetical protein ANCCEY_09999 [Ancylostoma ceylanicum]